MPISYLERDYFQRNSQADEFLLKFETTLQSLSPQTLPIEAKAILFRSATQLFYLLSRRAKEPLHAIVYQGWLIDGLGAVPLGNERFLEITAQTKSIIIIRKRE